MTQQVIFIHGGETFDSYDDYLEYLRSATFDPERDKKRNDRWSRRLQEDLGEEFEVIMPTMPSKYNAKYREWKIWFEKVLDFARNDVIFIGHSLGGMFLVKYLAENEVSVRIKAVLLVSAPYDPEDSDYSLADFVLPEDISKFEEQGGRVTIYHSKEDAVVLFSASDKYHKSLPSAEVVSLEGRGHFLGRDFPEILEKIKSLSG